MTCNQQHHQDRIYLIYIEDFRQLPIINKMFSGFYVKRFLALKGYCNGVEKYAHNFFVDILLYTGIFGVV